MAMVGFGLIVPAIGRLRRIAALDTDVPSLSKRRRKQELAIKLKEVLAPAG